MIFTVHPHGATHSGSSHSLPPGNCRFECDDVNQGLEHYKNSQDVVHLRCAGSGIEDGQEFFYELFDILRPGGILLVVDGNYMHGEDRKRLIQDDENAPVRSPTLHGGLLTTTFPRRTFRGWRCWYRFTRISLTYVAYGEVFDPSLLNGFRRNVPRNWYRKGYVFMYLIRSCLNVV